MRIWVGIWVFVLMVYGIHPADGALAAEAPRIQKEELRARLGNPDVIVIDVRAFTDWLFTREKIKGAVRESPKEFDEWMGKYPNDKTIVLYCA